MSTPIIDQEELLTNDELFSKLKAMFRSSPRDGERGAWIIRGSTRDTTKPTYLLVGEKNSNNSSVSFDGCLSAAVAQVHTHPSTKSPKPSGSIRENEGDWAVALKCKVPVYVLSVDAIWKVLPIEADEPPLIKVSDEWLNRESLKPSK